MKFQRASLWLLSVSLLLPLPLVVNAETASVLTKAPSRPKNIVIMIGDGMGPSYTTAYRYFKDNPDTEEVEQTVFDRLLVGMASTYPAGVSGYVTDSAAAATALATGVKTYNGAISVDPQKQPLQTLFEKAKARGMSTGVAVTSQINHATPAAFLSHDDSRKHYDAIAQSYLDTDADVLLGGGQDYFPAPLLAKFAAKGYRHISHFDELEAVTAPKLLGLFAPVQLPWALDDPGAERLSTMTTKALALLSQNQQGFVLLVEGSLIDWAGHGNDIANAMGEMGAFANAVEVVEQFVRQHPDTLMLVTADHNTGGLSIGAEGQYLWEPAILRSLSASPDSLAKQAMEAELWKEALGSHLGFTPDHDEFLHLAKARMQGQEAMSGAIKHLIDKRTHTGWTTSGHTATDVQVFAAGPAAELFNGHQDNTDLANKIFSLMPKPKKN
ncbi:alkaline phosphatase [Shewanella salipaludis]|uniref:Alkaline phosphatase n=1 Tax=Shewanella salipaludis TaxID=2723052 RepID=A0A972JN60_9GAMM|nr:alkaline phosphatase [Shewanella salipaludis]NMH65841.1 alkaline phosphatase [Shewanella salipaludis]